MDTWPFEDPPNSAAISLISIMRQGKPILYACHDEDGWQFLDGEDVRIEDAMVVGLGEPIECDPTLLDLADCRQGGAPGGKQPMRRGKGRKNPLNPWSEDRD